MIVDIRVVVNKDASKSDHFSIVGDACGETHFGLGQWANGFANNLELAFYP